MPPYLTQFSPRYDEVDRDFRVLPVTLFNFIQETAIRHSCSVGRSPQELMARDFGWFMTRIHMRIDRYPQFGEEVRVRTWPYNLSGLYAVRELELIGAEERRLGAATTQWVMMNLARRRPVRIPAYVAEAFDIIKTRAIDDPFEKLDDIDDPAHGRTFHVRASDLDSNGHANSAAYIDWCLESTPHEIHEMMTPTVIEIGYKRESKLGDEIRADSRPGDDGDGDERSFAHRIHDTRTGEIKALGRTRWRLRTGG